MAWGLSPWDNPWRWKSIVVSEKGGGHEDNQRIQTMFGSELQLEFRKEKQVICSVWNTPFPYVQIEYG